MARLLIIALALFASAAAAQAASAPEVSRTERAEVRLVSDHDVVAPGGAATLALHQRLAANWHSYWRNPGDSGLETTIAWSAPEGVEVGPIEWPTPTRIPLPPLMNYGYSGEATLLNRVSVPADWPVGEPIELQAQADWLVCEKVCIPESQLFTISLPTGAEPAIDAEAAELVASAEARLPAPLSADARARHEGETIRLSIDAPEFATGDLANVYFFAADYGVLKHSGDQQARRTGSGLELILPAGETKPGSALPGVLRAVDRSGGAPAVVAFALSAPLVVAPAAAPIDFGLGLSPSILAAALLAFLGGAILNFMPCVFPVLALKAISFSQSGEKAQVERRRHAAAYGGGVLLSFLALAGALIALKSAGAAIGWGFQLQTPIVVAALAYVMVLVGLNLTGLFELPGGIGNLGGRLAGRGGPSGSFFTGVLAVAVASPCTAPFMGAALGYAMTQDALTALVVFAALGLGFAAPLVALSLSPRLARLLPRPGPWMARLRQALSFPMFLTAAWLLWVLGHQAGMDAVFAALVGMVLMALAGWALGAGYPQSTAGRRVAVGAAALALVGAVYALAPSLDPKTGIAPSAEAGAGIGERYSPSRLEALRAEGRQVMVNFTADWCISCKFNERVVLSGPGFRDMLSGTDTIYMVGDWTRRDAEIAAALAEFGRVGVPLYVVYPANGGAPKVLPQILTEPLVSAALGAG